MFDTQPILRYFECRGRAQHLRYFLIARDIPFQDDRIPLDEGFQSWIRIKDDPRMSGPFHKLPLLQVGDIQVVETPVIHQWLHEHCGDLAQLDKSQRLHHAMLTSSTFGELIMPLFLLIYSDLMHPGTDVKNEVQSTMDKLQSHLASLDTTLAEWNWCEQWSQRPVMLADTLLWEALNIVQQMFPVSANLNNYTILHTFYTKCPGREHFIRLLDKEKIQLSARPDEKAMIDSINEIDAALSSEQA